MWHYFNILIDVSFAPVIVLLQDTGDPTVFKKIMLFVMFVVLWGLLNSQGELLRNWMHSLQGCGLFLLTFKKQWYLSILRSMQTPNVLFAAVYAVILFMTRPVHVNWTVYLTYHFINALSLCIFDLWWAAGLRW